MGNEGSKGQQKAAPKRQGRPAQSSGTAQQRQPQQPQRAGGDKHSKAAGRAGGPVLVWGEGTEGQLGLGAQTVSAAPVPLPRLASLGVEVHQLSCGPSHAAFVAASGTVYVCGSGDSFRLGLGDRESRREPTEVPFTVKSPCVQVECGETFTLFLTQRGNVLACGTSKEGALGLGYSISAKMPMKTGLGEIRKLAVGKTHAAAISHLGKVYTWGSIAEGKLGHASDPSAALQGREAAPKVLDNAYTRGKRFVDVACGAAHTIVVTEYGEVSCCGRGEEGQLGYGGKQEHTALRKIELVDDEEKEDEDESSDTYIGAEEVQKRKQANAPRAVRCFANGNASGVITAKGDVWLWGDGELLPTKVKLPAGEKALLLSLHPTNSLVLTDSRSVFAVDLSESQIAECLEAAPVDNLANTQASWIANGGTYFCVARGAPLPTLDETRSRVVEAVENQRAAKEHADNRKELFGRAKKPNKPGKREIDKVEVQDDTNLSKMKADLFALPSKRKEKTEDTPVPQQVDTDDMDLDDFKATIFQSAGGEPPAAQAATPESATQVSTPEPAAPVKSFAHAMESKQPEPEDFVEADPEARNALFALPVKKKTPKVVNPFATEQDTRQDVAPPTASATDDGPAAPSDKSIELRMDLLTPKNLQAPVVEELYEGDLLSDDEDSDDLC